jgi:hypothetical protein
MGAGIGPIAGEQVLGEDQSPRIWLIMSDASVPTDLSTHRNDDLIVDLV